MKRIISIILVVAVVITLCFTTAVFSFAEGPVIATQPTDVIISYPNGATFTVVPADESEVAAYQWYFVDSVGQEFKLEGTSAKTNTLVLPATDSYYNGNAVYCILTGKNGDKTQSEYAYIDIDNGSVDYSLLFVNNYAIKPGESLDLSTTELGSGVISYSSDRQKITLNNVNFDNTNPIFDNTVSPAIGIYVSDYATDIEKLTVNVIGNNVLKNTFYQENYNSSGITVDLGFLGLSKANQPDIEVSGTGTLKLIGGTIQLRALGNLTINCPITFEGYNNYFCDAINGNNVDVNSDLKFDVNGTIIYSTGSININSGASIDGKTTAPYVMGDYTRKNAFLSSADININDADVTISLVADPSRFIDEYSGIDSFMGFSSPNGDVSIKDSNVKITIDALPSTEEYFYSGNGIDCNNLTVDNSVLDININSNEIIESNAIMTSESIDIKDSTVNVKDYASDMVFGIATNGTLSIKDSNVSADCAVNGTDSQAYGLMYRTANIDLSTASQKVSSKVNKGFAIGANIGNGEEEKGYDSSYAPAATKLVGETALITPTDAQLNQSSMLQPSGRYTYLETVYSLSDTSKASTNVVISIPSKENNENTASDDKPITFKTQETIADTGDNFNFAAIGVATFGLIGLAVTFKKKNISF